MSENLEKKKALEIAKSQIITLFRKDTEMKLEEYKSQAITRLNKSIAHNEKEKMNYACMGLFEETGEVIAEFRKQLFKGNFHEKPLDIEDLKSENQK